MGPPLHQLSIAAYLAWEEAQPERNEFFRGEVIEVLSPSTQRYDRSEKFAIYRKLASLREDVLIDPETRRVEVYRPQGDGAAMFIDMTERGELELESIGLTLTLAALFKDMQSEADGPG